MRVTSNVKRCEIDGLSRPGSIVHRLSSTVYRPSSTVHRLVEYPHYADNDSRQWNFARRSDDWVPMPRLCLG